MEYNIVFTHSADIGLVSICLFFMDNILDTAEDTLMRAGGTVVTVVTIIFSITLMDT